MSRWLYRQTERSPPLYTVGFFPPGGEWEAESDHSDQGEAAKRVHWLNGGTSEERVANLLEALEAVAEAVVKARYPIGRVREIAAAAKEEEERTK